MSNTMITLHGPGWQSAKPRRSPEHVTREEVYFLGLQDFLSPYRRRAKNCYRSLRTGAFAVPFLLLWGKSPETQSDPVCVRHGKRLPLRRQVKLHVWCLLVPFFECGSSWGSAVQTLGHIRDDMSGPSVGHIPLRNSYAIAKSSW